MKISFGVFILYLLSLTNSNACEFTITEMTVKLVQSQSDLDPEHLEEFAEVSLKAVALEPSKSKVTLNYQNSLQSESDNSRGTTSYDSDSNLFHLRLSKNFSMVFVTLGKNSGTLNQISLLNPTISQDLMNCKINVNEIEVSPILYESRSIGHTPYPAKLLEEIYPLEQQFRAASTKEDKERIATQAYLILFSQPTPKLKILLTRSGISEKEAIQFALFSRSNEEATFPSIWRSWGPDYVPLQVLSGMDRLHCYGNLTNVEASNIVWDTESTKDLSESLTIRSATETITFKEYTHQ